MKTILVPVDGSANSRLAVELATDLGRVIGGRAHAAITLLHVAETKSAAEEGAEALFKPLLEGIDYGKLETRVEAGTSRASTIIAAAEAFDLVIIGESEVSPWSSPAAPPGQCTIFDPDDEAGAARGEADDGAGQAPPAGVALLPPALALSARVSAAHAVVPLPARLFGRRCDRFDLRALARRSRDHTDSGLRKSEHHCPAEPAASACHNGNVAWDLAGLHIRFH